MVSLRPVSIASLVALLVAVPSALAAGSATRERVDILEQDLHDAQGHIVELQDRVAALEKQIKDLRAAFALDTPGQRITPADLAARLASVETDLRVLYESSNESTHRLSVMSDKVDAVFRQVGQIEARAQAHPDPAAAQARLDGEPPPSVVSPTSGLASPEAAGAQTEEVVPRDASAPVAGGAGASGAPTQPLVDPEELYQSARADFGRGSYDLAESGFQEFLDRFPDSELADNALYWVGECRYSRGEYEQSIAAFDAVASRWPEGDKTPDAGYKKGLALLALNRTAEGIVQLQRVKDAWPTSPAGRLARGKLQSLGLL